ncbi:MAG: tetratricopeptide repeat protein [Micropepsaceae bacterium]
MKGAILLSTLLIATTVSTFAHAQLDTRHQDCGLGDVAACFSLEFGRCADPNPRLAITACTRQLVVQDNRVNPGNLSADRAVRYALRGNAYVKRGDIDRALSDYDRAIASDRSAFWIQMTRANAYFLSGNNEEALHSFDAAANLSPDSVDALIYRALILAAASEEELREPALALTDAQRVDELTPGQPAYIDVLAVAYAANGEFEKAAQEAQRAIDLLPVREQAPMDDFRSRLDLYAQGLPFLMDP